MHKCRYPKLAVTESAATFKVQTLFSIPRYPLNHTTPWCTGKAGSPRSYKGRTNVVHLDSINLYKHCHTDWLLNSTAEPGRAFYLLAPAALVQLLSQHQSEMDTCFLENLTELRLRNIYYLTNLSFT